MMYIIKVHRTQLLLNDWQYVRLKNYARQSDQSISKTLREILDRALGDQDARPKTKSGLMKICGLGRDPGFDSRHIDDVIYRLP